MGIISRLGAWLDTRFPEKISADTVLGEVARLNGLIAALGVRVDEYEKLYARVTELEKKADVQVSEMNKAKVAFMNLRTGAPTLHR